MAAIRCSSSGETKVMTSPLAPVARHLAHLLGSKVLFVDDCLDDDEAVEKRLKRLVNGQLALLENIQRQDLNVIEEGKAYANLLKKYTVEELAKKLGYKKTGPILDRTQLLNLAPEYQDMVVKGTLSTSEAYEMSRLPVDRQQGVFLKIQRGELNSYNKLFAYVQGVINLENQAEIFALAPLSEKEQESIASLSSLVGSIERFIARVQEQDKAKHLEKAVFHSDVSPERIDYIIGSLQKIRRTILVGDGVKKAMQAA